MDIKEIIHNFNKDFSVDHKGTLSVSKCLDSIQKGFDQEGVAKKCYDKGYADPESKYYQMTVDMILESWQKKGQESCHYGSMLDSYIGMNLNKEYDQLEVWKLDNSYDYDTRLKGLCDGFDQFYKTLSESTDYEYVAREEKLFVINANGEVINGRFDCLFYSPSLDKYMLIDWKSSGEIDKENKWENLLGPCFDLPACNGNTYSIQLQMYKKALCETYKITTPDKIDVFICQMSSQPKADGKNYTIHKQNIEYNTLLLDKIIEFAYKKKLLLEKSNN